MDDKKDYDIDDARPPEWLREILDAARASVDHERRCEEVGTLVWNVARLRDANRQRAFELASLRERVARMAGALGIDLTGILTWFGVSRLSLADPDHELAHFGRELDFTGDDLLAYVEIGEAMSRDHPISALSRAGNPGGSLRDRCMEALRSIPWDSQTRTRLRALKEAIDDEYNKSES